MDVAEHADQMIHKLNETDIYILNYIRRNKTECCRKTIEELAAKCNVSRTTILRFSQKLGFSGYSEMKTRLKWECEQEKATSEDPLESVCDDYKNLIDTLRERNCDDICRLLHSASRVFVYGTGALQDNVARELQGAFLSAHLFVYHIKGTMQELALAADMMTEKDAVIIISFSGESETGVTFAKLLKARGVPIISLTKLQNNSLAKMSAHNLYVNSSAIHSIFTHGYDTTGLFFIAVEILFIKYLNYLVPTEQRQHFAPSEAAAEKT